MRSLRQFVARKWEAICGWGMLALFLLVSALWLGGVGKENPVTPPAGKSPRIASLLNPATALLFQKGVPDAKLKGNGPFALPAGFPPELLRRPAVVSAEGETKVDVAVKPARGWKNRPPTPPPPTPPPDTGAAPPQAEPRAPTPPPQPKRKPVEYLGCMTTLSGKVVALLRDPQSGSTTFVEPNGQFDGLKVKGFTPKQITVQDAKGTDVTIGFGQQDKLLLE